jgi:hypothetical protein
MFDVKKHDDRHSIPPVYSPDSQRPPKRRRTFSTLFSPSTRLTLTYIVLFVWIALAIFAILMKADMYALAVYFTSGLPVIIGYLWAQTSRPSSMRDAAQIVGNIRGTNPGQMGYGGEYGGGYGGGYQTYGQPYNQYGGGNQFNQYGGDPYGGGGNVYGGVDQNTQINNQIVNIYADDATAEIQVNEEQLTTLMNTGYVDTIQGKYTFKKSMITQIKSLIDNNTQDPNL